MRNDKTYTVLIVDDNDDVRRLLRKVLEAAGYEVVEAVDGGGALKLVEHKIPDLVLMDIRLPGELDGMETTAIMKESPQLKRVPVVALSASVLEKDQKQAIKAGCSGFISKPVDVAALPALLGRYISRGTPAR